MSQFEDDAWHYLDHDNDDPELPDCQNGLHVKTCRHAEEKMPPPPPTLADAVEVIRGLLDHLLSDHAGRSRGASARAFLKRVEARHG